MGAPKERYLHERCGDMLLKCGISPKVLDRESRPGEQQPNDAQLDSGTSARPGPWADEFRGRQPSVRMHPV